MCQYITDCFSVFYEGRAKEDIPVTGDVSSNGTVSLCVKMVNFVWLNKTGGAWF